MTIALVSQKLHYSGAYTQGLISGGAGWRAREHKPIMEVWGLCPQRGPGGEAPPPEAESYKLIAVRRPKK